MRTEGISKALRDDYAAFSLAAISYSMLHTTHWGSGTPRRFVCGTTSDGYADAISASTKSCPGSWIGNWPRTDTGRIVLRSDRPGRWWPKPGKPPRASPRDVAQPTERAFGGLSTC